ncbi:retrovirus-related pol polyprotein from transposon TNT 1-94 [Tanacetum coccineum]
MFRINPSKTSREDNVFPNKSRASVRKTPITVSQPHVIHKENVNSNPNGFSSIGVESTAKTRRPQPRSNTKNDRVRSASISSGSMNKEVENAKFEVVCGIYGVDLLKGSRTTNLYTINLHERASASPIFLMACATSTKSWLWHQRLSHLNFDTINDLARNDLLTGLPKFKYHKEYLCPSCEQGKSKKASHPPKPIPNSKQRLHLLHMDFCGPIRVTSINGKRYVLVIVDNYSHYVTPQISLQQKTGFGIVTSWHEDDLIREIDLYMPIYQCRLLIFRKIEYLRKTLLKCQHKVGEFIGLLFDNSDEPQDLIP